ncbi:hypothetical protein ABTM78_21045, partial [Acinetobacter baumannii]
DEARGKASAFVVVAPGLFLGNERGLAAAGAERSRRQQQGRKTYAEPTHGTKNGTKLLSSR